jgi:hypothetical protein
MINWVALNQLNALVRQMEVQTRYLTQALDLIEMEKDRALRLRDEMQPLADMLAAIDAEMKSEALDAAATHAAPTSTN